MMVSASSGTISQAIFSMISRDSLAMASYSGPRAAMAAIWAATRDETADTACAAALPATAGGGVRLSTEGTARTGDAGAGCAGYEGAVVRGGGCRPPAGRPIMVRVPLAVIGGAWGAAGRSGIACGPGSGEGRAGTAPGRAPGSTGRIPGINDGRMTGAATGAGGLGDTCAGGGAAGRLGAVGGGVTSSSACPRDGARAAPGRTPEPDAGPTEISP